VIARMVPVSSMIPVNMPKIPVEALK
jgi:hypothetical protein